MAYYLLNTDGSNTIERRDVDADGMDRTRVAQLSTSQFAIVASIIRLLEAGTNKTHPAGFTLDATQDVLATYYAKWEE